MCPLSSAMASDEPLQRPVRRKTQVQRLSHEMLVDHLAPRLRQGRCTVTEGAGQGWHVAVLNGADRVDGVGRADKIGKVASARDYGFIERGQWAPDGG